MKLSELSQFGRKTILHKMDNSKTLNTISAATVNRDERDKAAVVIRQFIDDELPGDTFEKFYPLASNDRAVFEIELALCEYIDSSGFRLPWDKNKIDNNSRQALERCILFLNTDNPWPYPPVPTWKSILLIVISVPLVLIMYILWPITAIWIWWEKKHPKPENIYWPFTTEESYQEAYNKFHKY